MSASTQQGLTEKPRHTASGYVYLFLLIAIALSMIAGIIYFARQAA